MKSINTNALQQLVNGMCAFVGIFSRDGKLLEANPFALAAGDSRPEELYGRHVSEIQALSPTPESLAHLLGLLERAANGETARGEVRVLLAGGRPALIDALFLPLLDENGGVVQIAASGVEVTAHKDAEAALLRANRQLRMLSSCNQALVRTESEAELLGYVCNVIVAEGGYRFAWVGLAERDAARSVRPAGWAGLEPGYLDRLRISWDDTPAGRGPTGRAIRQRTIEVCPDIGADAAFEPWRQDALRLGYACSIALPIMIETVCVGALNIYSDRPPQFDATEIALLTELTNDLAYGLRSLRTRSEHRRTESQLQLFRRLLDRTDDMVYVVDARTGRILDASEAVARKLGYSRAELLRMNLTDISVTAAERPWQERVALVQSSGQLVAEVEHRRKDGTALPVEVRLSYVEQLRARYLICIARDISSHKRQHDLIEHMARVLRMQSGINAVVLRIRDRDDLLNEACRLATQVGGYDRAVVSLVEPDGRHARPQFRAGIGADFPEPQTIAISDGTEPDDSLTSRALRTGAIVVSNDLSSPEPPVAMRERLLELGFKTVVALPLIVEGRKVGVLTLTSRNPAPIGDDELLLLEDMAASLSFALRSQAQNAAFEFLASYDSLTGLANRTLFCQRLETDLKDVAIPGMNPAVVAFDIHHLSSINDTFGRRFGDLLLQKVAERLRQSAEGSETIGYLGGGTFVLIQPELLISEANISSLLETTVFEDVFSIEGREIRVSCRSGVARAPVDGRDADTLLQKSEAALKRAKDTGEPYLHYKLEMHSEVADRLALEHRLRQAVDAHELELYYQPQLNIATGRIEAVEALLRWNDAERGVVLPAQFLPLLESSGLIVSVGQWALTRAVQDCCRWAAMGLGPVRVAVNVSPLELRRRTFVKQVLDTARHLPGDVPGFGLDLEITETALLQDVEGASHKLRELRAAGIRIALDDFGTGYSSLGLLTQLRVDILKIDRSFVAGLPEDRASVTLARTIMALASAFGLITVGEGVETAQQLDVLKDLRCDYTQGYLHSRPLPASAVERILPRIGSPSTTVPQLR